MFYDGYLHVKYILSENVFSYKHCFQKTSDYFLLFVCDPKNSLKNIFQLLAHMKNNQIFLIFSYNLQNCDEERDNKKKVAEKVSVKIKSIQWWN